MAAGSTTIYGGVTGENISTKGLPVEIVIAVSDETTNLATGTNKVRFRMPFPMTLISVKASVNNNPVLTQIIVDICEEQVSILSTKLMIATANKTSFNNPRPALALFTLSAGASGSVDTLQIDGVDVMSGAENFDTSLSITADNIVTNIMAHTSVPNYTATNLGAIIFVNPVEADFGTDPNGFTAISSATTITVDDLGMSGGADDVVISDANLADDAEIEIDIDQVGDTSTGKGLKVTLIGVRA